MSETTAEVAPPAPIDWPDRAELDSAAFLRRRDSAPCTCGHARVSHGSYAGGAFVGIGRGPCGIDRDTRNAASGYLGDPCPCEAFTPPEEVAS